MVSAADVEHGERGVVIGDSKQDDKGSSLLHLSEQAWMAFDLALQAGELDIELLSAEPQEVVCGDEVALRIRRTRAGVLVEGSPIAFGPWLLVTPEEWIAFTEGAKIGEFRYAELTTA